MKPTILIGLLFLAVSCKGQEKNQNKFTLENFDEQILNFKPVKNKTNESSFTDGVTFLEQTTKRIRKNQNMDVSDYWNILTIFSNLKESDENIDIAFEKLVNTGNSCEYLMSFEQYFDKYLDYLKSKMISQLKICNKTEQPKESFNVKEYSKTKNLDGKLVELINSIRILDQKDRRNLKSQKQFDIENQLKIDSLYNTYQTYIGKSLVGKKLENVMWQVVQHSNQEMMDKYLPIIQKAVEEKELEVGPFKMLIDRFYGLKYGYQIFGSQSGFELADDKKRKEIKLKYGIE